MIQRLPNWQFKLTAFIESRRWTPFGWGVNDCCLFACDGALAITGTDFAADYRGRYKTALGAKRLLMRNGAKTVSDLAENFAVHGKLHRIDIRCAQRGDFVTFHEAQFHALGICLGEVGAFLKEKGVAFKRRSECQAAFTY